MKNYYKTLCIDQNSSKEEIKKAFRELALKYHPDKNNDQIYAEKFKEINEAKQVLLDDFKKFQYDDMLATFSSKNSIAGKIRTFKRRNILTRSLHFQLIKDTVVNKSFLAILLIIAILSTIAFYEFSDDESTLEPALITKSAIISAKEPSAKPELVVSYSPTKRVEKKTISVKTEKIALKPKTSSHHLYLSKKVVKKLPFNDNLKIVRHTNVHSRTVKKRPVIIQPFAVAKTNNQQGQQKQLTNEKMTEILNQIKAEKLKVGSNSNCVQVIKSEKSNISNVFMLANFLRSYGFIISGREKISSNINGINIDAISPCITVTVGTL